MCTAVYDLLITNIFLVFTVSNCIVTVQFLKNLPWEFESGIDTCLVFAVSRRGKDPLAM